MGPQWNKIGEFSVVTNAFNAEYGRTGSWFTNITIRSGTNQLHGSVYDYFANDALNARSFFQAQRSIVRQNEGGFTLGRSRLHSEDLRWSQEDVFLLWTATCLLHATPGSGALFTVPTEAFRNGDFSGYVWTLAGAQIPIYDPLSTRQDSAGNVLRDQFPEQSDSIKPNQRHFTKHTRL